MAEDKVKQKKPHSMILENRNFLSLSGVLDVGSFDEQSVVIYTDFGELNIKGSTLHINKLSLETGEVSIDGNIVSLIYTENRPAGGLLTKLFR